ncbi:MAG: hypothetical protein Tsb0034_14250 [Ekhidna sp.]
MKPKHTAALLTTLLAFSLSAQDIPKHEKGLYKNEEGKLYVNKALPVFLSISTQRDGSDAEILEGKEPKYSSPMYLDSEGYNSIRSPWQVDPETKEVVYPKKEVVFELYADSKPPVTTLDLGGDKTNTADDVTTIKSGSITLTATDETSGVRDIYYSLDGASYQAYTGSIALNEEKSYSLKYYAVDFVGNAEEIKSINLKLDKTPPISELKVEGDLHESVVSSRSTLVISSTDNTSGVSKTFYSIDEGKTFVYDAPITLSSLGQGEHTIEYFAVDKVDNNEEKKSFSFYVDKTAPRVIDEIIGNTFIANGKEYYSGRTKLKLVAMDNKSGVKEILYSVNGGEFVTYTDPFYLKDAGTLNIEVMAIDNVNNSIRTTEFSDKNNLRSYVDLSGPKLSHSISGPSFVVKDTTYINNKTKISLLGSDEDSGFKEIDYQIDAGTTQKFEEAFTIESEGFHKITFNGYDNLDNSSSSSILCFVDNTGPEVFHRFSINSNKTKTIEDKTVNVYPPHALLFLSATDRHAGLDKISYQINGGASLAYRSLIENFKKETLYTITVSVTDKLGNLNEEDISFYIE